MPRAPKKCGHRDCQERVVGTTYCPTHKAERQRILARRRGSTTARGYGPQHRADRAAWAPQVALGNVCCWRCGEPITQGQAWDMGHDDNDRSLPALPEHANKCNRTSAGMKPKRRTR